MKRCRNCDSMLNDSDRICSSCGNTTFYFEQDNNNEQQNQFITYVENVRGNRRRVVYETQSQPKEKGGKISKILSFIFAGFLLFLALGLMLDIINKRVENNSYNNYIETEQLVDYTKGSVVDGIYINEWADIKIDLNDGWVEGNIVEYEEIEDEYIYCGFYGKKGVNTLTITFINTGDNSGEMQDEYLKEYILAVGGEMQNVTITEPVYEIIGNFAYLYSDVSGNINGDNLVVSAYMRSLDKYTILISVTGNSYDGVKTIVEAIQSVNDN